MSLSECIGLRFVHISSQVCTKSLEMRSSGLMRLIIIFTCSLCLLSFRVYGELVSISSLGRVVFNVMLEGATGDGRTDEGLAFHRTWKKACKIPSAVMYVPAGGKFALRPSIFAGPCAPYVRLQVEGTIVAIEGPGSGSRRHNAWLEFKNLRDFSLVGHGKINGKGTRWWTQACRPTMKTCLPGSEEPPNGVVFQNCTNVRVSNLKFRDSPKFHLTFTGCDGVYATALHITAPKSSPNTDGIHLKDSRRVFILNNRIRTGDDCVSIQTGSSRVLIQDIVCGPGHGISVGSLGKSGTRACVWGIRVNRATFDRTLNGFRIKSWQGGSGHAHGIRFMNSRMHDVKNPVVIDQYYCDSATPCANETSAVAISEIIISNITGTTSSSTAVDIKCSDYVPCRNIVLQNITIRAESNKDETSAKLSCWNAYGYISDITNPMTCALQPRPTAERLPENRSESAERDKALHSAFHSC